MAATLLGYKILGQTITKVVEEDEDLYLPNCQTNLVIVLHVLSLFFWHFINKIAYQLG